MRRISLAVGFSLLISMSILAQEGTPKSDQYKMTAKKRIPPPWKMTDGLEIAKLPRVSDKEPEFAIVRLSDIEYKKFRESPKDWVNGHHILQI